MTYNNEPKQTMWEIWFTISVILLLSTIVIGTFENSRIEYPNWPYWAIITFINFCISLGYGMKKK